MVQSHEGSSNMKPNPADPLANPFPLPQHNDQALPLPRGQEIPSDKGESVPPLDEKSNVNHPLGPRDVAEYD